MKPVIPEPLSTSFLTLNAALCLAFMSLCRLSNYSDSISIYVLLSPLSKSNNFPVCLSLTCTPALLSY